MLKSIPRYTTIKGVTIYSCDSNWKPKPTPAAIDRDITIPEQTHPTTDVNLMGTVSIPDQSRIDNMTLTVNVNCDSPEAGELTGGGVCYWKICWVDEILDATGEMTITGYNIYASGYVTGIPEAAKNAGAENSGDLGMNLISIKKTRILDNGEQVVYDINRVQNRLIRNGKDYRAEINRLL